MSRLLRRAVYSLFGFALAVGCEGEARYHDKPLEYWVAALRSPDAKTRAAAVEAIAEASPRTRKTVDLLLDALSVEADTSLHPMFAQALGRLGEAAAPAVPRLAALLRDDHLEIREPAAVALGNIGSAASPAVPDLARALHDCCHDVRAQAAESLGRIGPAAGGAAPALIEAMNDPISWVRLKSAEALIAIGLTRRRWLQHSHARSPTRARRSVQPPPRGSHVPACPCPVPFRRSRACSARTLFPLSESPPRMR